MRAVTMVSLGSWDELDDYLAAINEAGFSPDLPFVDAHGNASIAHGTAPSGDDWVVALEGPRDPDSGSVHCCECYDHGPRKCDAGLDWRPAFPIVAITAWPQAVVTPQPTDYGQES